ncbi:unnamed protein product [Phytophthora fragariaefolia]|uniref:Unnamed protein product n=1 Tax=Phytophthora fragariaefolia TaxID=1490495 RepID=A0A9W6YQU2_9STRA|nr:unnamed protein product [Phytophthora fragariaefolia]
MAGAPLSEDVKVTVLTDGVLGAGRPAGRLRSSVREVSSSPASQKEQVPGTTLLCLSVAAARSNLVVVTASVKGYPEPMTVLIDSGASFNFATKASVAKNNALYASALEASKSNTNVSVRLATGSIVSTRKVTIPLKVRFDDFDSVEPFIVLDMDDRYDLILGMPWLAKHEPWIDWRSRTIGASHNPLADRALVGHVPSSSRDGFVHEHRVPRDERQFAGSSEVLELPMVSPPRAREPEVGDGEKPQNPNISPMGRQGSAVCNRVARVQRTVATQGVDAATARAGRGGSVRVPPPQRVAAGSAHVGEGAGVVTRANESGRAGTTTTQGVVAGSARATEGVGAGARATTGGRAGAPTNTVIRGDKVTNTPKAEASDRDADPAAEDRAPQALNDFTGEPKVGEVLARLPTVAELLELEELSYVECLDSLKAGELAEVVLLRSEDGSLELNSSSSVMDSEVLEDARTSRRQSRYGAAILKDPSDPYYPLLKEFSGVVSDNPPSVLPPDRGVRHEISIVPRGSGRFRRNWSTSSTPSSRRSMPLAWCGNQSHPTRIRCSVCASPTGSGMVHAFNKLNAATIPASTPIPRKDVLQNNMAGCTVFSALDMVDGYYQLLMRESDIPLTAVSTPSGMLWEWLVMPQGLSNAPATFNRLVTQLFRPMRHFIQTYFDDGFVHSRASEGKTAVEAHLGHLREVLLCMRENNLYANINKCSFGADEIPFLGCFLGKEGGRADPEKVFAIAQWPVPVSQKVLRKWLGLANYLHKYSANYAEMARPLTNHLMKDVVWSWTSEAQQAFEAIKNSLQSAPILALPDEDRPYSVVCDASDFAIGCAQLQVDAEGRERVVCFQSRQLKAAEKNYPVHDKELLAMKYALVKFRVHLLDYELAHLAYLESPLYELIRKAYADDDDLAGLVESVGVPTKPVELTARQRSRLHRYSVGEGLLYYQVDGGDEPWIVVPNDEDLRHRVLYEAHDTSLSGHLGREKTYTSVARKFWWPHMYKSVRKYVQTCETCQRVKPSP